MLRKIFGTQRPVIGMVHFSPMLGYDGFESIENILKKALFDLNALMAEGVDGVMVENNYDLPHQIIVGSETVASMTFLTAKVLEQANVPLGINVLWNDYRASLAMAKVLGAKFIRVPVFVDKVQTAFGIINGDSADVIEYRKKIQAEEVAIFTDIQVKHATMLDSKKPLSLSAQQAINAGSDGLIITGKWTGDAPKLGDLEEARIVAGNFPILVGSGATQENIKQLLKFADGVIVSTSLKSGHYLDPSMERNVKPYQATIDVEKVKAFVNAVKPMTKK